MHTDNDRVSDRNDSAFDGHEDDSSQYNMNESAYMTTAANEKQVPADNMIDKLVMQEGTQVDDEDNEGVFLRNDWSQNPWESHASNDDIEGLTKGDRYDGLH